MKIAQDPRSHAHAPTQPNKVILRWHIQRHVAIIPKSVQPARLAENMSVFDFELTEREMDDLEGLNRDFSFIDMRQLWVKILVFYLCV